MTSSSGLQAIDFAANRATGRVDLDVMSDRGVTRRARVGESGSLRVRFPGAPAPTLQAVTINTAGGIAGGDRFSFEVGVGDGASLMVTSASAEKVYRSLGDESSLTVSLTVGARGRLAWLPRETIVFDGARLDRVIEVDLAEDAGLVLAEAVIFGRTGMGETVVSGRLGDRWRIRREGRLIYAETLMVEGAIAARLARKAVAGGGAALATLVLVPQDELVTQAIREIAEPRGEIGVSSFNGLTVVRFCADDGERLRHDLTAALRLTLGAPLPTLWLN